jgi:hypothetical protein
MSGDPYLVFETAALRADPGLTLLLATAEPGKPTEAALHRLSATREGGRAAGVSNLSRHSTTDFNGVMLTGPVPCF